MCTPREWQGRACQRIGITIFLYVFTLLPPSAWGAGGWYLVAPPIDRLPADLNTSDWGRTFSEVAAKLMKRIPLSEWVSYGAFDTAKECEAERATREKGNWDGVHQFRDEEKKTKKKTGDLQMIMMREAQYWGIARCVASDDPRLRR
jgi:hypothetical protein